MNVQKKFSSPSTCSRLFQREYDMEHSETGQLVYSVYAAPQQFDALMNVVSPSLQRFVIVWGETRRYEIFELIDQALFAGVFSPIALLHLSEKTLTLFLSQNVQKLTSLGRFYDCWQEIARTLSIGAELQVLGFNEFEYVDKDTPIALCGYDVLWLESLGVYGKDKIKSEFDHAELVGYCLHQPSI